MEHFFLPASQAPVSHRVPYLCDPPTKDGYRPYDGGPFATYPSRLGKEWLLPSAEESQGKLAMRLQRQASWTSVAEQEKVLQAWLFFGLLSVFLGDLYEAEEYIEEVDGHEHINACNLVARLDQVLNSQTSDKSPDQRLVQYLEACRCLAITRYVLHSCSEDVDWNIRISIASTVELFGRSLNRTYSDGLTRTPQYAITWIGVDFFSTEVCKKMIEAGWCPFDVSNLSTRFDSLQTQAFLSHLDQTCRGRSHEHCSEQDCTSYQIVKENYHTAHVESYCSCELLTIDIDEIHRILESEAIPILQISKLDRAEPMVQIVASSPDIPYVASSHVWSDGLGNPERNELPICQLKDLGHRLTKLQRRDAGRQTRSQGRAKTAGSTTDLLSSISSSFTDDEVYLWIDTICCPASPGHFKSLAVSRLRNTYESAWAVLVLDNALKTIDASTTTPIEKLLRLLTSAWIHRLWTLQEGFLAGDLWVEFCSGPEHLGDVFEDLTKICLNNASSLGIYEDIEKFWKAIRPVQGPVQPSSAIGASLSRKSITLDRALLHRSVSFGADEPLCVATLLGLNPEHISNLPEDLDVRMGAMWTALAKSNGGLPQSMILLNYPRIKRKGLCWAPQTLMKEEQMPTQRSLYWSDPVLGKVTEQGFVVRYRAISLSVALRTDVPASLARATQELAEEATLSLSTSLQPWPGSSQRCTLFGRTQPRDFAPKLAGLVGAPLAVLLVYSIGRPTGTTDWDSWTSFITALVRIESSETSSNGELPVVCRARCSSGQLLRYLTHYTMLRTRWYRESLKQHDKQRWRKRQPRGRRKRRSQAAWSKSTSGRCFTKSPT